MINIEALAKNWTRGALVFFSGQNEDVLEMIRPAAFVYATPVGFAWVEPSYADPWGAASPSLHFRNGVPREEAGGGFRMVTKDAAIVTVLPYQGDVDLVGDSLEWFAQHLAEAGKDWETERERLRSFVQT